MGHIHLGVLPKTRNWQGVVSLLSDGAPDAEVISASARAAELDLSRASHDPVFTEAVRLLLMVPFAARSEHFGTALREIGLTVGDTPDLLELVGAVGVHLDRTARLEGRSDLSEMASRALVGTFSTAIGDALPGLFEATTEDVRLAARSLSWSRGVSDLSRAFFGDLISGALSYWLDRTLALHVGLGKRFNTPTARGEFDAALATYTHESTRISVSVPIIRFAPCARPSRSLILSYAR